MKKIIPSLALMVSLLVLLSPKTFAADTASIRLTSDVTNVTIGQTFLVNQEICSEGKVSTFDLSFQIEGAVSVEEKSDKDVATIVTEQSYEGGIARLVAGNPDGIGKPIPECEKFAQLEITAGEGDITISLMPDGITLGAELDSSREISVENENKLVITVGATSTTEATETSEVTEDSEVVVVEEEATDTESTTEEVSHDAPISSLLPPTGIQVESISGSAKITWEIAPDAQAYKVYYAKKTDYDADNSTLSTVDILGNKTLSHTLSTLEARTEYIIFISSIETDGTESSKSEAILFTTKAIPVDPVVTTTDTIVPELHDSPALAPQPTAYIVQDPQQQPYKHTESGPEHILIGIMAFVLLGWFYLRKKLA